jgi:nickel/cobalt transporter (NicO) family protein
VTTLRRALVVLAVAAGILLVPAAAWAHPLGNFTINAYAGVVVRPDAVLVDYVVDMAEIPSFQERGRIDRNDDGKVDQAESDAYRGSRCASLATNLTLEVDGAPVQLRPGESTLAFRPGAADLTTLRLTCLFSVAGSASNAERTVTFADENFRDRLGWHEVTATGDRMTLSRSSVPSTSGSDRLRSYPKDVLPLDVRSATLAVRPGGPALAAPIGERSVQGSVDGPERPGGSGLLADLAGRRNLSIGVVAVILLVALGVGALHALGPGHGKSLIGVYLVGSGGSLRQAVSVGAAVSVMHTASVLALGVIVISAERVLPPERVYPWLGLGSGLIALALGASLLVARIHRLGGEPSHPHEHEHDHETDGRAHGHIHPAPAGPLSRRGLLALAISGGVLPSPSALVVLLVSVSLGRTIFGLAVIAAFSVGLAASLVGVGALALGARDLASRHLSGRLWRLAPVASAATIALIGAALTIKGITQV